MAITFSSNINLSGKFPDFVRQEYATLEDMRSVRDNRFPEMYLAYCLETYKYYFYSKRADQDPITGRWRELPVTSIQTTLMSTPDQFSVGKVYQYIGTTTDNFTRGYFYLCTSEEEEQTVEITTVDQLAGYINNSDLKVEVNTGAETEQLTAFVVTLTREVMMPEPPNIVEISHNYCYIYNDTVYMIDNEGTSGNVSNDTAITSENINLYMFSTEDMVTVYSWINIPTTEVPKSTQVIVLPEASASELGKIYQFIGNSTEYTINGYFYECAITGSVIETHAPQTVEELKYDIEHYPTGTIEVNTGSDTEELNCLLNYYVYDDTIYRTDNETGDISTDTALTTDEMVADEHLMYEVDAPVYDWVQKDVQPGGSGGASTASDVSYSNLDYPALDNVEKALNNILGKIYYVEPKVNSFTMTPSTTEYEIGASVSNLVFNWTTNKDITTQTLTDCTLADATVRTATAVGPYTSNKTFTLSIGDGENTATSSKSISFKHKVYWGSAADGTIDSAFILALSNKKFATNYKGTYSMTVAQDEYGYLAYPSSWGTVTSWFVGGFEVTVHDCGEVSFTNASGNTTTFRVIRTTQPSLGAISPEVK